MRSTAFLATALVAALVITRAFRASRRAARAGATAAGAANDPIVLLADEAVTLVPLRRARAQNALWFRAPSSKKSNRWCALTRIDDAMDITMRCEASHSRWGSGPRDPLLGPREQENLHWHDGGWAAACQPDAPPTLAIALTQPFPPSRNLVAHCSPRTHVRPTTFGNNHSTSAARLHSSRPPVQLGEAKVFVAPSGDLYLYGYVRDTCKAPLLRHLPSGPRSEYIRNDFKNFICRFVDHGSSSSTGVVGGLAGPEGLAAAGCAEGEDAALLHYSPSSRPEASSSVAKNFLLWTHGNKVLAIALIEPHRIYKVNPKTGRMKAHASSHRSLGFADPIGLSAGPVAVTVDGRAQYLVGAHVRRGSWPPENSLRMTFFYTFEARHPFAITAVTPLISFGASDHLEYMTHMELHGKLLHVSLGADDCATALFHVPVEAVLRLLKPLDRECALCPRTEAPEVALHGWRYVNESKL